MASRVGSVLDGALIAVALLFILVPELRVPALKTAVWTAFLAQGWWGIIVAWKAGWLTRTPQQIFETIRQSGPPKRRRFETLAFFLGAVASALALWG